MTADGGAAFRQPSEKEDEERVKAGLDRCPHAPVPVSWDCLFSARKSRNPTLPPSSLQQREHLAIPPLPSLSASLSFSDVGRQKNGVVEGGERSTYLQLNLERSNLVSIRNF